MKVYRYIHEWSKLGNPLVFHTFPMVHIGESSFYQRINEMCSDLNEVLMEGVPLKTKALGRYQRFSRLCGLDNQYDAIKIPDDIKSTNIDIKEERFKKLLSKLPLKDKMLWFFMDFLLKVITKKTALEYRNYIVKKFSYDESNRIKLIDPRNYYASRHKEKSKLDLLIENFRNDAMIEALDKFLLENSNRPYRFDVGILVGDAHMPHIYQKLLNKGFNWRLEETVHIL